MSNQFNYKKKKLNTISQLILLNTTLTHFQTLNKIDDLLAKEIIQKLDLPNHNYHPFSNQDYINRVVKLKKSIYILYRKKKQNKIIDLKDYKQASKKIISKVTSLPKRVICEINID